MTTSARDFIPHFRVMRAVAARGETVRVRAAEGVYTFQREKAGQTCGGVLDSLMLYRDKGFWSADSIVMISPLNAAQRGATPLSKE